MITIFKFSRQNIFFVEIYFLDYIIFQVRQRIIQPPITMNITKSVTHLVLFSRVKPTTSLAFRAIYRQ
jgi:hypothetical protein